MVGTCACRLSVRPDSLLMERDICVRFLLYSLLSVRLFNGIPCAQTPPRRGGAGSSRICRCFLRVSGVQFGEDLAKEKVKTKLEHSGGGFPRSVGSWVRSFRMAFNYGVSVPR